MLTHSHLYFVDLLHTEEITESATAVSLFIQFANILVNKLKWFLETFVQKQLSNDR